METIFKDLKFGLFLHFYQPIDQDIKILDKIVRECYRPLLSLARKSKGFTFSANFSGSLLWLLKRYKYQDVLDDIKYCVKNGIIEIVATPYFHPICPLTPEEILDLEIYRDKKFKEKIGINLNSKGFFPPEMAFNKDLIKYLKSKGIKWIISSDISVLPEELSFDKIESYEGFPIFLRSEHWSKIIWDRFAFGGHPLSFREFKEKMIFELGGVVPNKPWKIIIAMDAETFGHHIKGAIECFLKPMFNEWIESEILCSFERMLEIIPKKEVNVRACSWSTSHEDLWLNKPYPLWDDKDNCHHQALWNMVKIARRYFSTCKRADKKFFLEMHCSCAWWWVSRDHWFPEFTNKIVTEKALYIICKYGKDYEIAEAYELYHSLKSLEKSA
jgi:hypothetical protein